VTYFLVCDQGSLVGLCSVHTRLQVAKAAVMICAALDTHRPDHPHTIT